MIYILTLLAVSTFGYIIPEVDVRPIIPLPEHINDLVTEAAFECIGETGAEQKVTKRVFQLKFDNDDLSKKFLYCLCIKSNFGDWDGHLTEDLMQLYEENEYKDDVRKVFERCNKIQKKERIQTMYEVVKCFSANTPVILGEKV